MTLEEIEKHWTDMGKPDYKYYDYEDFAMQFGRQLLDVAKAAKNHIEDCPDPWLDTPLTRALKELEKE